MQRTPTKHEPCDMFEDHACSTVGQIAVCWARGCCAQSPKRSPASQGFPCDISSSIPSQVWHDDSTTYSMERYLRSQPICQMSHMHAMEKTHALQPLFPSQLSHLDAHQHEAVHLAVGLFDEAREEVLAFLVLGLGSSSSRSCCSISLTFAAVLPRKPGFLQAAHPA